ncbi:MAG TPA: CDP-archaeol synthase [Desulfobacterales bacterium]|nr:CDP-archaeol synthase [Desulfobacterales bacterium]
MMKNRIITGVTFGALWLLVLLLGSFKFFWFMILVIACMALYEFFTIALPNSTSQRPAFLILALLPIIGVFNGQAGQMQAAFMLALFLSTALVLIIYSDQVNDFTELAKIISGITLISLTAAHLVLLMSAASGRQWLILLTLITTASDTGAYFTGTLLGRHKLCPAISPGKTWEGLAGGLIAAVIVTIIAAPFIFPDSSILKLILVSLLLSIIGVGGDMTESIFKRSHKVKDSGAVLPGHGGILDRVDSILAAAPVLYYAIKLGIVQ